VTVPTPSTSSGHVHDVLVIGGGPSGSACAYWLAEAGWDVAVVEKKRFPRVKTCGDGLTPRSVRQLADMGVEEQLTGAHRYHGLRSVGFGRTIELVWPEHPDFPNYGYTITRHDLDGLVCERAVKAGATVWQGTEVLEPIVDGPAEPAPHPGIGALPHCAGAVVREGSSTREIRARYVVVADGANSRVGRTLGLVRDRALPQGMALRGYYRSDLHDEPWIESHLDIRDAQGDIVPGYGWIFPLGDGRVNVGVGLLSTDRRWKGVNTTKLMEAFVAGAPKRWGLNEASSCGPPTGGRLPMGMSVTPRVGPNALVVGDAGGLVNPFNGEGIAYGYETGRLAAASLGEALCGDDTALDRYEARLRENYADYYRVGRAFVRIVSNPALMRACVSVGMRSEPFMAQLLRIMANLMRPETTGPAEAGYMAMIGLAKRLPEGIIEGAGAHR
jgi:geranylgeranyl reductase family protein